MKPKPYTTDEAAEALKRLQATYPNFVYGMETEGVLITFVSGKDRKLQRRLAREISELARNI